MRRRTIVLLAFLSIASGSGPEPLRIIVTPKIAQAPSDVHLKIFVARNPANRWLDFGVDGPNFGRSSGQNLDGDEAPGVVDVWYKRLPCGRYDALARVLRADGSTAQARQPFELLGCNTP